MIAKFVAVNETLSGTVSWTTLCHQQNDKTPSCMACTVLLCRYQKYTTLCCMPCSVSLCHEQKYMKMSLMCGMFSSFNPSTEIYENVFVVSHVQSVYAVNRNIWKYLCCITWSVCLCNDQKYMKISLLYYMFSLFMQWSEIYEHIFNLWYVQTIYTNNTYFHYTNMRD